MTARRQYGTGSVYQRTDGRWVGRIEAGWSANGARRRIAVVAKTEAACKAAIKVRMRKLEEEGAPVAGTSNRATVKSWADVWLERTKHGNRPKSWATDVSSTRKWVVPVIGHKRLDQLTPGDIRSVSVAIRKAGLTSSTARRAHVVMIKMLRDATLEGHPVPPRILLVEAPAASAHDRDAIPLPDALALLEAVAGRSDASRWAIGFLQGVRQGEALGLTWSSVDLAAGVIDVSWQLQAIPYAHGCGDPDGRRWPCKRRFGGDCPQRHLLVPDGFEYRQLDGALCLVRPKTEKGKRVIPLVPWMVQALADWKRRAPASPHDLVWPRPNGRPQTADGDAESWREMQDTAQVARVDGTEGRRYGIHEMRHSTATLLLESGVDPETVKSVMGHSSIVTSRGYMHVGQPLARDAMEKVAGRLGLTS